MARKRTARLQRQARQQSEERQIVAQKAVGYVRVSTDEQASAGYGLEALVYPGPLVDTSSPIGQTIFAVLAGMAAQEGLTIIQRTLAGNKEKASRGGGAGGPAPLGYARDKEQTCVELHFKAIKEPEFVGAMYVNKPERLEALAYVVLLVALVRAIIE